MRAASFLQMPLAEQHWSGLHAILREDAAGGDGLVRNDQAEIERGRFPQAAVHRSETKTARQRGSGGGFGLFHAVAQTLLAAGSTGSDTRSGHTTATSVTSLQRRRFEQPLQSRSIFSGTISRTVAAKPWRSKSAGA